MAYNISNLIVIDDSRNLTANITNLKTVGNSSILGAGNITEYATTNLGVIITTSGTSASKSGLTLTGFSFLKLVFEGVSHNSGTSQSFLLGTSTADDIQISPATLSSTLFYGICHIALVDGTYAATVGPDSTGASDSYAGDCPITTASTAISVAPSSGSFDAGKVIIYGLAAA